MTSHIEWFVVFAITARAISLVISLRNEARLKAAGAEQYGAKNSVALVLLHIGFYAAVLVEAWPLNAGIDFIALAGMVIYLFSMAALAAVIYSLGRLWTLKIYIAKDAVLVKNWLMCTFKHPNYYLNVITELIGFALALHAWWSLAIGLPIYLLSLRIRIHEEEKALKQIFPAYH